MRKGGLKNLNWTEMLKKFAIFHAEIENIFEKLTYFVKLKKKAFLLKLNLQ